MIHLTLDTRGLKCPWPVLRVARALRDAPPGTTLTLYADDPMTAHELPRFCEEKHYHCTRMNEEEWRVVG